MTGLVVSPFRLGEWLVDPVLIRLSNGGWAVHLEPKVMDVLVCLANQAPKLVTREQLIDTVWATQIVSDNTLTRNVAKLRSALGDDAKNPSFIETIPRRGYRLLVAKTDSNTAELTASGRSSCFAVRDRSLYVQLMEGDNLIGRSPSATIAIDAPDVSRRHARIFVDDTIATLEDLGSKNQTLLNGRPVHDPAILRDGDEISIAGHTVHFEVRASVTMDEDEPTKPLFED